MTGNEFQLINRREDEEISKSRGKILAREKILDLMIKEYLTSKNIFYSPLIDLAEEWNIDKEYMPYEVVNHAGVAYVVWQAHTSQIDWSPGVAKSLFYQITYPNWQKGQLLDTDVSIAYDNKIFKTKSAHRAGVPPNEEPALYEEIDISYKEGAEYKFGELVSYKGDFFRSVSDHRGVNLKKIAPA